VHDRRAKHLITIREDHVPTLWKAVSADTHKKNGDFTFKVDE